MIKNVSVGLIRPISKIDGFSDSHFEYLETIVKSVVESCDDQNTHFDFQGLVSKRQGVSFIGKNIVSNIFAQDMVIAAVSGLNANVMFELGLRLSQRKPCLIIADSQTKVPFDINAFEYISYPRELSGAELTEFKQVLTGKLKGTWEEYLKDSGENTFIAGYSNAVAIQSDVDELSLNQAIDKLSHMMEIMRTRYVSLNDNDIWDSYDFNHDISVSPHSLPDVKAKK